jgi:hypothetical protein
MAKIKLKNRLQAIAATKIKLKKAKAGGNPPKRPAAKKGSKKAAAKKPTSAKKATPAKKVGVKKGSGKGRPNLNVKAFGEKYFTKVDKASGAGGGSKWVLKNPKKFAIRINKFSTGTSASKYVLLVDKKPKTPGKGKTPIQKMKKAGYSKNGKLVIKVDVRNTKYSKRTNKVVRTAASKNKANRTRIKNMQGAGAVPKKPTKGKAPASKAKAKKPASKGTSRIKTAAM